MTPNLFQKYKLITRLPVADISHHHTSGLRENVVNWANGTQPKDVGFQNISLSDRGGNDLHPKINAITDPLQSLSEEHVSRLTPTHKKAIDAYVTGGLDSGHSSGSKKVNWHLISAHENKQEPQKHFKFDEMGGHKELHLDHLDDALKQNRLKESLITYSGVGFHPSQLAGGGEQIHLPAYTSSSTNRGVALLYTKPVDGIHHVIKISHPPGSTGVYVGDADDVIPFRQKEHISPRGMVIQVNKVPEVHHDEDGNTLHVWSAGRLH